jgi:hypothetical protein
MRTPLMLSRHARARRRDGIPSVLRGAIRITRSGTIAGLDPGDGGYAVRAGPGAWQDLGPAGAGNQAAQVARTSCEEPARNRHDQGNPDPCAQGPTRKALSANAGQAHDMAGMRGGAVRFSLRVLRRFLEGLVTAIAVACRSSLVLGSVALVTASAMMMPERGK